MPRYWKHSKTILLHKKGDPLLLTNSKPIALANTIYKSLHQHIHCPSQKLCQTTQNNILVKKPMDHNEIQLNKSK